MASDAAGLRAAELASYSAEKLVNLLGTTYRRDDFDAVARVLTARERRAAEAEADLEAIHAAHEKQAEEYSDSIAMIVEETEAKLKTSFSKIHAPLKKPERDAVPSKETPGNMALALANLSIEVPQQSEQQVAADGSGGKSLKRKADEVEIRGVSPLQISGELQDEEDIAVPPGYSPTPKFSSFSLIYEKAGACSNISLSQPINFSAQVSKGVASGEGSGKTVTLKGKEPMATDSFEETGEGPERNAPIETTQDQGVDQETVHLEGAGVSLFTVPVQLVERFERATVSKRGRGRGRGRGRTASKEKKNKNVSGSSPSRGRGGRARSNLLSGPCGLKRPSPLGAARPPTVQNYYANLENAGNPSRNDGQANMNIASGYALLGIGGLLLPTSSPIRSYNVSGAGVRSMCGMGSSKVTENLGKCVLNKADSIPVMNNDAEGTSDEEGAYASKKSKDTGGASTEA